MVFINGRPQQIKLSERNNKEQIYMKPLLHPLVVCYSVPQHDMNAFQKGGKKQRQTNTYLEIIPQYCRSYLENKYLLGYTYLTNLSKAPNLPACCLSTTDCAQCSHFMTKSFLQDKHDKSYTAYPHLMRPVAIQ